MFGNVHLAQGKLQNRSQFRVGMSLAWRKSMKQSVSVRYLMLLAGVLVAVMIAITFLSESVDFTANNMGPALPNEKLINTPVAVAKVLAQKVAAILF